MAQVRFSVWFAAYHKTTFRLSLLDQLEED
jgi:hypothetical protein